MFICCSVVVYPPHLLCLRVFTDLICEPSYFKVINNRVTIEKHIGQLCADVVEGEDIYFPAFIPASQKCIIQRQLMLFSCVGEVADLSRLCPCRDYIPGQTALCKHCLWYCRGGGWVLCKHLIRYPFCHGPIWIFHIVSLCKCCAWAVCMIFDSSQMCVDITFTIDVPVMSVNIAYGLIQTRVTCIYFTRRWIRMFSKHCVIV